MIAHETKAIPCCHSMQYRTDSADYRVMKTIYDYIYVEVHGPNGPITYSFWHIIVIIIIIIIFDRSDVIDMIIKSYLTKRSAEVRKNMV